MRSALKAIAAHLRAGLDAQPGVRIAVHRDRAVGVAAPYVIIRAGSHPVRQPALAGPIAGENGGTLLVQSVHSTADGARLVADRVRAVLSPGLGPLLLATGEHSIQIIYDQRGVDGVEVDLDVTLPNTATNPAVAFEEYIFSAQPL